MAERRSNRAKKSVDYSKFGDGDDIDDDFRDSTPPPSKKQKISSKEKNEKKKDSSSTANDNKKRVNSRASLKDDIYDIELQAALELSMSESQSSQEAPTLELEPRVPEVDPHVVCISDENEPPPNLNKVKEPVKVVSRKSDPTMDEIEVLGTVYEEEAAPAKSKRRAATSKAKKIKSDDDVIDIAVMDKLCYSSDSDFDAEDENLDEKSDDVDDEDFSDDDDDDSDFGDLEKKSKSKAKSKEKKTTTPSRTESRTASANKKTALLKPASNQKKNVRALPSGNKELCRTPGLSSTCKSPLTGVHIKSPNSSIRLADKVQPVPVFFNSATMAEQTEKSFQKQPHVFLNKKSTQLSAKGKKNIRHTKNIGLGFKTPREAIEGTYIDKKCPFTGNVSIRGRILTGVVAKMKMQKTIVIRRDYLRYVKKYNRFEKRHRNLSVHLSPCFRDVAIGDVVTVGECRPLSKTIRFNVLKVTKAAGTKKGFQKF
ncbi:hypothetical protein CHS0354_024469 [Potamilus streckersoni]|uniref:Small ribosomal subunit protein uS17 n=1 Tax=Potamilus streckersoni TaxID=2493646 RepID=A0AAE0TN10_9BIVA|nr:hypothetical protein CHS0354_024469 [Potamilus streckersoni]